MFHTESRPMGRLFYWAVVVVVVAVAGFRLEASPVPQSGPAMTTVADTVYEADGTPAQGNLIVTWPAFVTARGTAIAAGTKNVTLGVNGALSVALAPNAGANPAGVYYTVVYQVGPAVAAREIVQPDKFKEGISKIIDGTVECLNASTWAKNGSQPSAVSPQ